MLPLKLILAIAVSALAWMFFGDNLRTREGMIVYAILISFAMSPEEGSGKIIRVTLTVYAVLILLSVLEWAPSVTHFLLLSTFIIAVALLPYSSRTVFLTVARLSVFGLLLGLAAMGIATVFFGWNGIASSELLFSRYADLWPYAVLLLTSCLLVTFGRRA